jgi:hypothetical protein
LITYYLFNHHFYFAFIHLFNKNPFWNHFFLYLLIHVSTLLGLFLFFFVLKCLYILWPVAATCRPSRVVANHDHAEVRYNVFQTLQYLASYLAGNACVRYYLYYNFINFICIFIFYLHFEKICISGVLVCIFFYYIYIFFSIKFSRLLHSFFCSHLHLCVCCGMVSLPIAPTAQQLLMMSLDDLATTERSRWELFAEVLYICHIIYLCYIFPKSRTFFLDCLFFCVFTVTFFFTEIGFHFINRFSTVVCQCRIFWPLFIKSIALFKRTAPNAMPIVDISCR